MFQRLRPLMRWVTVALGLVTILGLTYHWGYEVGYGYGVEKCWDDVEGRQP